MEDSLPMSSATVHTELSRVSTHGHLKFMGQEMGVGTYTDAITQIWALTWEITVHTCSNVHE